MGVSMEDSRVVRPGKQISHRTDQTTDCLLPLVRRHLLNAPPDISQRLAAAVRAADQHCSTGVGTADPDAQDLDRRYTLPPRVYRRPPLALAGGS